MLFIAMHGHRCPRVAWDLHAESRGSLANQVVRRPSATREQQPQAALYRRGTITSRGQECVSHENDGGHLGWGFGWEWGVSGSPRMFVPAGEIGGLRRHSTKYGQSPTGSNRPLPTLTMKPHRGGIVVNLLERNSKVIDGALHHGEQQFRCSVGKQSRQTSSQLIVLKQLDIGMVEVEQMGSIRRGPFGNTVQRFARDEHVPNQELDQEFTGDGPPHVIGWRGT
jgi:hypothetical protein